MIKADIWHIQDDGKAAESRAIQCQIAFGKDHQNSFSSGTFLNRKLFLADLLSEKKRRKDDRK